MVREKHEISILTSRTTSISPAVILGLFAVVLQSMNCMRAERAVVASFLYCDDAVAAVWAFDCEEEIWNKRPGLCHRGNNEVVEFS